jgi:hypothetical protein
MEQGPDRLDPALLPPGKESPIDLPIESLLATHHDTIPEVAAGPLPLMQAIAAARHLDYLEPDVTIWWVCASLHVHTADLAHKRQAPAVYHHHTSLALISCCMQVASGRCPRHNLHAASGTCLTAFSEPPAYGVINVYVPQVVLIAAGILPAQYGDRAAGIRAAPVHVYSYCRPAHSGAMR